MADTTVEEAGASLAQDFGALLLELFSPPGLPGAASGPPVEKEEECSAEDPQDLLAVLTQAFLEPRDAAREFSVDGVDQKAVLEDRVLTGGGHEALEAGRMPTAKFAAIRDSAADKNHFPAESIATPLAATDVAASLPARQDEARPALFVPTPVRDHGWRDDFAQKVTWMATQHTQSAELKLNPPALGKIEISIRLDNERAAVANFVSGNAEVRESIEAALPRLREMLAGVGIALGQAQVGAESFPRDAGDGQRQKEGTSPSGNELAILAPDRTALRVLAPHGVSGRGLVDTFV
jgi:flagellar hook-length control protein FliK